MILFTLNVKFHVNHKEYENILSENWLKFFNNFACLALPSQNYSLVNKIFSNNLNCIILTGGNDAVKRNKNNFSLKRNKFEFKLIDFAIKSRVPVIGICRGMHIINLYFGGKVSKNLNKSEKNTHLKNNHSVKLQNKIKKIVNKSNIEVNAFHTQGFYEKNLGKGLKLGGVSNDNLVEAIYHENYEIYGFQWHPERNSTLSSYDKKLFSKIIKK